MLDANPGFYSKPQTVGDIIDFIVGRCLDQLGIDHKTSMSQYSRATRQLAKMMKEYLNSQRT